MLEQLDKQIAEIEQKIYKTEKKWHCSAADREKVVALIHKWKNLKTARDGWQKLMQRKQQAINETCDEYDFDNVVDDDLTKTICLAMVLTFGLVFVSIAVWILFTFTIL